jgi:hypothetical protein
MVFHAGGHKPQYPKTPMGSIMARISLAVGGVFFIFYGSLMLGGFHISANRYGGIVNSNRLIAIGVILVLAASLPLDRFLSKALTRAETKSKSKKSDP